MVWYSYPLTCPESDDEDCLRDKCPTCESCSHRVRSDPEPTEPTKVKSKDALGGVDVSHPSFGMISIHRVNSSKNVTLFGNNFPHNRFMTIEIQHASMNRGSYRDWFHGGKRIISVDLSLAQFSDLLTSFNTTGVPCTISYLNGEHVDPPTVENRRVQFDDEFEEKMMELASPTNRFYEAINEILSKPSIGKHDRKEIINQIEMLQSQITNTIPFIKRSYTDEMNATETEAKVEITAFFDDKLRSMGLEGLKKQLTLEYRGSTGETQSENCTKGD